MRRGWYLVIVAVTLVVLVEMGLIMGLAVGFLIPLLLVGTFAGGLFYFAVRHQGVRNPLSPHDLSSADRWGDGQPEERIREHDLRKLTLDEVDELEREAKIEKEHEYDQERAEVEKDWDPRDYQGPPPINPFP